MKRWWAGAIVLAAGLWRTAAAEEVQWRQVHAAAPPSGAAVSLGRPEALESGSPVRLDRPTAQDAGIRLTSYSLTTDDAPRTLFRGQIADPTRLTPEPAWMVPGMAGPPSISTFATDTAPPPNPLPPGSSPPVHSQPGAAVPFAGGGPMPTPGWNDPCSADACADADCACDGPCCGPQYKYYASAEYLLWWVREAHLPPLVTTGPNLTTGFLGTLGGPGTVVLVGGRYSYDTFSGGRFTLGYWFDQCQTCAVEGDVFCLGQRSIHFVETSGDFPVLARPFREQNNGQQISELVFRPGFAPAAVRVDSKSDLWGADANFLWRVCCNSCMHWDLLAGFRYLQLDEGLGIQEQFTSVMLPGPLLGSQGLVSDQFNTRNQFFGGQLGTKFEYRWNNWFVDLTGKFALGVTHQVVDINGEQVFVGPGGINTFQGGLLALPSNIGNHSRNQFTFVPELGLNLGYNITDHCRIFMGYTVLYWSNVLRPGDQVDQTVDVNQIPNFGLKGPTVSPSRPLVPFRSSDYWAQGVNFGLELRY
jgi:hypothetical protein